MNSSRRIFASALVAASAPSLAHAHEEDDKIPAIDRTALIHGAAGPFAVAGYRMGQAALRELKLARAAFDLEVIHHSPAEVQWSCIVDGLQAATGASLGKLNLKLVDAPASGVYSIVRNKKTGREIKFELADAFIKSHLNLPAKQLMVAGLKVVSLPEAQIFRVA